MPGAISYYFASALAVKCGQPYREILSYTEENEIDLICMGVHGAGFAMRALFGSNTDRVSPMRSK
jgi:nucleotide-binding universal stress UspA family protein